MMLSQKNKMSFIVKGIFFCLLILFGPIARAQNDFFSDITSAFDAKPRIDLRVDLRNSFITTRLARIRGVKLGLDYNKTIKLGLSYNWLVSSIRRDVFYNNQSFQARLRYHYFAPYFEYAFYRQGPWEIAVPIHVGVGWTDYYRVKRGQGTRTNKAFVLSYEPYMMGSYTFLRYFALGAGVGYRLVLVGNADLNENFNSPIYVFKFQVLLGKLWFDLKPRIN